MDYLNKTKQQLMDRIALLEWFKREGVMDREDMLEMYTIKDILEKPLPVTWGGKTYRRPFSLCTVKDREAS